MREDYGADCNAWDYFSHDQARSRAYRWGDDGLGGISDDRQLLCFALALWNGRDPILKERLFGLTNSAVVLEPQVSDGSGSPFRVQQAVVTNPGPGIVVKPGERGELMSTRVVEFCALWQIAVGLRWPTSQRDRNLTEWAACAILIM